MYGLFHENVNHDRGEYVSPSGTSVNGIEGFWAKLKRSINGTHVHVSSKQLWKYAKEAGFRFDWRDCEASMLSELLTTFRPLPEQRD